MLKIEGLYGLLQTELFKFWGESPRKKNVHLKKNHSFLQKTFIYRIY